MLKLNGTRVAIQGIGDPEKTRGGLWIPDVAKERCDQGIVKYIGSKCKFLQPGDYVLFGGYDGTTIRLEGEGYLILMREETVKCKILDVNTDVSGLYFKGKPQYPIRQKILDIVRFTDWTPNERTDAILNEVTLWLNDTYFPATYEMATQLITEAFTQTENSVKHRNPYNVRDVEYMEEENE